MLKFITNLFGSKKAEPAAPYKIETPTPESAPVVNSVAPVVNGRKTPTTKSKTKTATATGNAPTKKKVSPGANKKSPTKK
jgi:hypothetical protein